MASVAPPESVPYDPAMPGSPTGARGCILIAEDEDGVRDSLTQVLREEGYEVVSTADGNAALAALGTREFDVVVSDVRMPGADGLAVLRHAREVAPQTLVLLMTAHATVETAVAALRGGAQDYLLKPVMFDDLLHKIESLMEHRQLAWERQFLRSQVDRHWDFENLVGQSSAMREVMSLIKRVAPMPSTVLITGESGVGKEVVAEAARLDLAAQLAVGGRNDPHVDLGWRAGAHREDLLGFDGPQQLDLQPERQIPDLVEKDRAPPGALE